MLNCVKGDMAIVIKGKNAGKIVTIIDYAGPQYFCPGEHIWIIDRPVAWSSYVTGYYTTHRPMAMDSVLRPIRDSRGDDEMLALAGLPKSHKIVVA